MRYTRNDAGVFFVLQPHLPMLTLQYLQQNTEHIVERLKTRNQDYRELIDQIKQLDEERRSRQQEVNDSQAELNNLSKQIGQLFKEGRTDEANKVKEQNAKLKESVKEGQQRLHAIEEEIRSLMVQIPNVPHETVEQGKGEEDNVLVRQNGQAPDLGQDALPHWELAKKHDIIDFDLGNKITGRGFPVYKNEGARLQRAMISYFLDKAREQGYQEVQPPLMVNEDSAFATGQLPDKEGQMYQVPIDNFYLIPTAEVPVTNIYRDSIVEEKDLPLKLTAYTPCFRREAGSWGKEVRGLNRVHQFDKVEIVQIDHPERSYETLEAMTSYVESLIADLGMPYRVMRLCGGDLGFAAALTYFIPPGKFESRQHTYQYKGKTRTKTVLAPSTFETVKQDNGNSKVDGVPIFGTHGETGFICFSEKCIYRV